MNNEELREIFRNKFDAYDTRGGIDSVVMSMTEDRFVEVVNKLFHSKQGWTDEELLAEIERLETEVKMLKEEVEGYKEQVKYYELE